MLTAARRLIHPTLHSSSERFTQTATAVMCRAITCCSDLAAALLQHNSRVLLLAAGSHSSTDWGAAKAELAASSSLAMQEYWEAVYSRRHLGVKVARSSEVSSGAQGDCQVHSNSYERFAALASGLSYATWCVQCGGYAIIQQPSSHLSCLS